MSQPEDLINQIVRAVLKEIRSRSTAAPTLPAGSAGASGRDDVTLIDEPVITEDVLADITTNGKPIQIGPQAVLTPTARDFLKSHNVNWIRAAAGGATSTTRCWKAFIVQETEAAKQAIAELQRSTSVTWQQELADCTDQAAQAAIDAICRAECEGVVILAKAAQRVACLANRNERVRASVVTDVRSVGTIRKCLGANVYVVCPRGRSFVELRNILRAVGSIGTPQPPANWNN